MPLSWHRRGRRGGLSKKVHSVFMLLPLLRLRGRMKAAVEARNSGTGRFATEQNSKATRDTPALLAVAVATSGAD